MIARTLLTVRSGKGGLPTVTPLDLELFITTAEPAFL
jgi:hypothetical protein